MSSKNCLTTTQTNKAKHLWIRFRNVCDPEGKCEDCSFKERIAGTDKDYCNFWKEKIKRHPLRICEEVFIDNKRRDYKWLKKEHQKRTVQDRVEGEIKVEAAVQPQRSLAPVEGSSEVF